MVNCNVALTLSLPSPPRLVATPLPGQDRMVLVAALLSIVMALLP